MAVIEYEADGPQSAAANAWRKPSAFPISSRCSRPRNPASSGSSSAVGAALRPARTAGSGTTSADPGASPTITGTVTAASGTTSGPTRRFTPPRSPCGNGCTSSTRFSRPARGSAHAQLSKELGCRYRTAWHMLHLVREACGNGQFTLASVVEVDET